MLKGRAIGRGATDGIDGVCVWRKRIVVKASGQQLGVGVVVLSFLDVPITQKPISAVDIGIFMKPAVSTKSVIEVPSYPLCRKKSSKPPKNRTKSKTENRELDSPYYK